MPIITRPPTDKDLKDLTVNGKCSQCGGCCTRILPMTEKEVTRIENYIKTKKLKKPPKFLAFHNPTSMMCAFLTGENKCSIYSVRPAVCRNFICSASMDKINEDKQKYVLASDGYFDTEDFFRKED